MVSVANVSKSFGSVNAVTDLTFDIQEGEIVGLLGPNGAGKTTTMRMLTGFLVPDQGRVEVDGISVVDHPTQVQAKIGYLPENNPLYKDMLAGEMIEYSADLKGLEAAEKRAAVKFAVQNVDIADVYYRPIAELSKGYKQRVGLALALLHRPEILIMDEPTEGLDPNQRSEIRKLIKNLSKEHTIIMSTHVMQEVEAVCQRLIIVSQGRLVADGTPKELIDKTSPGMQLYLEVEGKDVERSLKTLKQIQKIVIKKGFNKRIAVTLTVSGHTRIQPQISRLAAKYDWIIWKLVEEEKQLEEVFHELTKD